MINILKHIIRGCGWLPYMGSHPGTGFLFFFVALGALAGWGAGWQVSIIGGFAMLALMGVPYCIGAYSRSKESEAMVKRDQKRQEQEQ